MNSDDEACEDDFFVNLALLPEEWRAEIEEQKKRWATAKKRFDAIKNAEGSNKGRLSADARRWLDELEPPEFQADMRSKMNYYREKSLGKSGG